MAYDKDEYKYKLKRNYWFKVELLIFLISLIISCELIYPLLDDFRFWWLSWMSWWMYFIVFIIKALIYIIISALLAYSYTNRNVLKDWRKSYKANMKWPLIFSIVTIVLSFFLFTDFVEKHNVEFYREHEIVFLQRRFNFFRRELGFKLFISVFGGAVFYICAWIVTLKFLFKKQRSIES